MIFIVFLNKFGNLPHSIFSAVLHVIAHDCTWLSADLHQNFYLSTFKSHAWIDFLGYLSFIHKASIFLLSFSSRLESFLSIDPLSGFPLLSSIIGLGGFWPTTWSFETHQLLYRARIFSLVSRFSSPISQWVKRFFTRLHSYLHIWRSWYLREKVIVMS